ncbi:hypothetical protein [Methylobacter sp. S3L5C]|uniref:hypothetical protein n=1 Tax=Methylobacter sp. S3L5C TaxID=2839024 RepID=UPI001FACFD45|nr:hypothetical protein [Methylobacter sp. S3L5C]UOA07346.1 hypothetical protein KKZ03_13790 [Methylobacter sp. S3L5C]
MRFIDVSGALSPMILNANPTLIILPLQSPLYRFLTLWGRVPKLGQCVLCFLQGETQ